MKYNQAILGSNGMHNECINMGMMNTNTKFFSDVNLMKIMQADGCFNEEVK